MSIVLLIAADAKRPASYKAQFRGVGDGLFAGDKFDGGFPDGDGVQIYISFDLGEDDESLMVKPDQDTDEGAVLIVSKPLSKDAGWEAVPVNHMVLVDSNRQVEIRPIIVGLD